MNDGYLQDDGDGISLMTLDSSSVSPDTLYSALGCEALE